MKKISQNFDVIDIDINYKISKILMSKKRITWKLPIKKIIDNNIPEVEDVLSDRKQSLLQLLLHYSKNYYYLW